MSEALQKWVLNIYLKVVIKKKSTMYCIIAMDDTIIHWETESD